MDRRLRIPAASLATCEPTTPRCGLRPDIEALEILTRGPLPSLILLDLMMPEMDGYAFRREQRAQPPIASVPVVILSAHANVEHAGRELQADGYLSKPLGVDALLAAVARFVASSSA